MTTNKSASIRLERLPFKSISAKRCDTPVVLRDKIAAGATVATAALLIPGREGGVLSREVDKAGEEDGSIGFVVHG